MVAQSLERFIWQRAGSRCEYCAMHQDHDELPFQLDHIVAKVHGGLTTAENLALACFTCNNHKGTNLAGIDPDSGVLTRLYHPRSDKWTEHFTWQGAMLIGLTPVGRTTIAVLRINSARRLRLREESLREGAWPPATPDETPSGQ